MKKKICIDHINNIFNRMFPLSSKDIDHIDLEIDHIKVGNFRLEGIRSNIKVVIVIAVSTTIILSLAIYFITK